MKMKLRKRNHPVWHLHHASLHPRRAKRLARLTASVRTKSKKEKMQQNRESLTVTHCAIVFIS